MLVVESRRVSRIAYIWSPLPARAGEYMKFQIIEIKEENKGRLYFIEADGSKVQLLFTWHSLDRVAVWNLSVEQVLETLLFPEEVVTGHFNRFIAHKRNKAHIIRAIYEYNRSLPVLITVYYPSADRYFKGGGNFADKILP